MKNKALFEAAAWMLAGVSLAMVTSTAHAQAIPLDFLDTMKSTFDSLRLHPVWPSIAAVFFVGGVGIYLKTHDMRALFGALGCALFIGFWVKQSGILSGMGLP
jgi:hypothetical protein